MAPRRGFYRGVTQGGWFPKKRLEQPQLRIVAGNLAVLLQR